MNHSEIKDLLIYDDVFPNSLSGFRYQEFTSLLEHFENSKITTVLCNHPFLNADIIKDAHEWSQQHLQIARKLNAHDSNTILYEDINNTKAKLFYTVFMSNVHMLLNLIEHTQKPFVFTLYPGGGFVINDFLCDANLRRILSSDYFHGVIVTQQITYDYLLYKNFCKAEDIHFIFGCVTPLENVERNVVKNYLADGKTTIDICFAAHKYTRFGEDKGYDLFIRAATELYKQHENMRFHVVGGFDETVIDVTGLGDGIKFYGQRKQEWLREFYQNIDIIISPNFPFLLKLGSFDGFPTASVTDAGLSKVAMFCTDVLSLNKGRFKDGEEIVIIKPEADDIVNCVNKYVTQPELLKSLSEAGCKRVKELYGYDAQIKPRVELFQRLINEI